MKYRVVECDGGFFVEYRMFFLWCNPFSMTYNPGRNCFTTLEAAKEWIMEQRAQPKVVYEENV